MTTILHKEIEALKKKVVPSPPIFNVVQGWSGAIALHKIGTTEIKYEHAEEEWLANIMKHRLHEKLGADGLHQVKFDDVNIKNAVEAEIGDQILIFLSTHIQAKNTRLTTLYQWWKNNILKFDIDEPKDVGFTDAVYKVYTYINKNRNDMKKGGKHSVNCVALLNLIKNKYS